MYFNNLQILKVVYISMLVSSNTDPKKTLVEQKNLHFLSHLHASDFTLEAQLGYGRFLCIIIEDHLVRASRHNGDDIRLSQHFSHSDTTREVNLRMLHNGKGGVDLQCSARPRQHDVLIWIESSVEQILALLVVHFRRIYIINNKNF